MRRLVAAFLGIGLGDAYMKMQRLVSAEKSGDESPHSKRSSIEACIKLLRKLNKIIILTLLTACAQP
ncbi:MAG: hypothetical protein V4494_06900, partial [Chlamydiota bacterium]